LHLNYQLTCAQRRAQLMVCSISAGAFWLSRIGG
jgi:hypothetical protein